MWDKTVKKQIREMAGATRREWENTEVVRG